MEEENKLTIEGNHPYAAIELLGFDNNKEMVFKYRDDESLEDYFYLEPKDVKVVIEWLQRELNRIGV